MNGRALKNAYKWETSRHVTILNLNKEVKNLLENDTIPD